MKARHHPAPAEGGHSVRFAWLVSFVATLCLVAILALAKSAQALPAVGAPAGPAGPVSSLLSPAEATAAAAGAPETGAAETGSPAAGSPFDFEFADDEEGEEEEVELEECEEEDSECEIEAEGEAAAPDECLLSSAQATVFASEASDKVRLTVHYAATAPALVAVDYGLHGNGGSLRVGRSKQQFQRSGTYHETDLLSDAQMAKAIGAKEFTVDVYAVRAPQYCRQYFERHLSARRAAPGGLTWADPEASFRR